MATRESPSRLGSRASRPGSRRALIRCLGGLAAALAVAAGVVSALPGASPAGERSARYGQIPSWLPKARVSVGRTVVATAAHPWLAVEGDAVAVHLTRGRVLVTAVGPAVPRAGQFPVPATSQCSFTVTLTAAAGAVPLRSSAFTIVDELGKLHHPRVRAAGGGPPPAFLAHGRATTLVVSDVLPTGNGRLRWAPVGVTPVVSWDFDVEID